MRKAAIAILLLLPFRLAAQQNIEAGLFLGLSNYLGDISENNVEFSETRYSSGGFLRYQASDKFKIKGGVYYLKISGDDANANGSLRNRGWSFESDLIEVSLQGEFHPFGRSRVSQTGIFRKQTSPYIGLGAGQAISNVTLNAGQDQNLFPEQGSRNTSFSVPIVLGVRRDFHENLSIGLEVGSRATFSDYIDEVSKNGNQKKNDWYSMAGITISWFFGGIEADQYQFK